MTGLMAAKRPGSCRKNLNSTCTKCHKLNGSSTAGQQLLSLIDGTWHLALLCQSQRQCRCGNTQVVRVCLSFAKLVYKAGVKPHTFEFMKSM